MGWTLMPIKFAFESTFGGTWGTDEKNDIQDRICVRVADFDYSHFKVIDSPSTIRNISEPELFSKSLQYGDILIEKSGGGEKTLVGRAVRFTGDYKAVCSNFVSVLRPKSNQSSRFWTYVLANLYANRGTYPYIKQSTGIQNLDVPAFLSQKIQVPSFLEQERIADQLDHELAEIDSALSDFNFVEKLVADKRKAFIDSFFTKESSQQKIRLRHLVTLNPAVDSNLRDSKDTECTLLPMESIQFFTPPKSGVTKKWSELISSYSYITPKDIAIAKVTPCFENGKGLLGADLSKPVFATTEVTVLRPDIELIHPNYLALFMQSSLFREPAIASMTGAGGLKRISEQEVLNTRIPLPTLKNQEQIVKTNLEEISKLKSLVTDINISKRILQERKVSLIQNLLSMSQ